MKYFSLQQLGLIVIYSEQQLVVKAIRSLAEYYDLLTNEINTQVKGSVIKWAHLHTHYVSRNFLHRSTFLIFFREKT